MCDVGELEMYDEIDGIVVVVFVVEFYWKMFVIFYVVFYCFDGYCMYFFEVFFIGNVVV